MGASPTTDPLSPPGRPYSPSSRTYGAVLDVYVGEFEAVPPSRLWQHPRVLITPHTSAQADHSRRQSTAVFCDNLHRFIKGEPLVYEVDWTLGY